MQQLQINLRKYLNQMKANIKMQQLIRFKENHTDAYCSCDATGWDTQTKNPLASTMAFYINKPRETSKEVFRDQPVFDNKIDEKLTKPNLLAKHQRCSSMTQLPQYNTIQQDSKKSFNNR
jgi:hypothetical protein